MDKSSDDSSLMFLGGAVAVVVLGMMVVKAVGQFFKELEIAFNNFGHMVGAFIPMLWNTFLVISLIVMTLAAVASGVYFTIKYFKLINEIAAARRLMANQADDIRVSMANRAHEFEGSVDEKIFDMRRELRSLEKRIDDALKKPELPPAEIKTETIDPLPEPNATEITEDPDAEIDPNLDQLVEISNPY